MKGLISAAAAVLVGICCLAAPAPTMAADDLVDCSSGCLIMTCDATGTCTVWECDGATGCQVVGRFQRINRSMQGQVSALGGDAASEPTTYKVCEVGGAPCAIKVCTDGKCEISVFDGERFVPAAVIDDAGHLVDRANRQLRGNSRSLR